MEDGVKLRPIDRIPVRQIVVLVSISYSTDQLSFSGIAFSSFLGSWKHGSLFTQSAERPLVV